MSLRVWLPLTNDLNNYGLSDVQMVDNGVTASENGKIGNCYYLNKKTLSCPNFTLLQNATNFSACCWVKFTDFPSNSNAYCICLNGTTTSDMKFILGIFSKDGETATFRLNVGNSTGTLYKNQWYHLAICVAGTTGYLYINGELKKTATVSTKNATNLIIGGRSTNTAGTAFTGTSAPAYYNDVRIYDHCLSKKEVKELAKGLILHYPLDNSFHGNWNLLKGNYSVTATAAKITPSGSCSFDTFLCPLNKLIGKTIWFSYDYSVEGDRLNNTGSYTKDRFGSHLSLTYKDTAGATKIAYPCAGALEIRGTGRTTQSYTIPSDISEIINFSIALQPYNQPAATNTNTWYLKNFKLEIGTRATPWTPNPTDIGIDPLRIIETSGYNRPGTAVQLMQPNANSARYNVALQWTDNTDFIAIPALFNLNQAVPELTITGWFKTNTLNGTAPNMFNFGANSFARGRIASTSALQSYWNIGGSHQGVTTSVSTPTDNNWHHYAFVFDNGVVKVYYDGALKSTNDFTSSGTTLICTQVQDWGLGGYTPTGEKFIGYQSDFRTYISVLTDADILELYEARPGVDKSGALYGYKLNETGIAKPAIRDTGVIEVPVAFLEEDTTVAQAAKITKDNIIANAFYEI